MRKKQFILLRNGTGSFAIRDGKIGIYRGSHNEDSNEVNQLNLFFVLEASLHRLQYRKNWKAAARCAFLMAYYRFTPLTPPASYELAEFYIDRALEWDDTQEYHQLKKIIDKEN